MNFWVFSVLIILNLLQISPFSSSSTTTDTLHIGSSLSSDKSDNTLVSKNGIFSSGFYSIGLNSVSFAIWVSSNSSSNPTLIWTANRDNPINAKSSKLCLLQQGTLIILTNDQVITLHSADVISSISTFRLQLLNTGNLALFSNDTNIVWQSFDSPTNTLLPNQPLGRNTSLISSKSSNDYSQGFYKLSFDNDNVLRLLYDGPEFSSPYWPEQEIVENGRSRNNFTRNMVMDSSGQFTSSDFFNISTADAGVVVLRRLTLDFDGNLRVYSLDEKSGDWLVSWQAIPQSCAIRRSCGPSSLCSYIPDIGKTCNCLPGYKFADNQDLTAGCVPEIEIPCGNNTGLDVGFYHLSHVDFYGFDMEYRWNLSFQDCKDLCKQWCQCKGFRLITVTQKITHIPFFMCFFKSKLLNGYYAPSVDGDMYVKLPQKYLSSDSEPRLHPRLNCSSEVPKLIRTVRENKPVKFLLWFAIAVGSVEMICIFLVWFFVFRGENDPNKDIQGYLLIASKFKKFSYSELKKATRGFSEEIGRGGGGIVGGGRDDACFSKMRGTRGYMAPEWVFNLPITSKVDVYSYGIVVLEMVTGNNPYGSQAISNGQVVGEHNKRIDTWVRQKMKEGGLTVSGSWIEDIVDPRLEGPVDLKKMEVMARVALRCVEENKDERPTMSQVVEMLMQQKADI
ncbi:hypothetical protein ACFE04_024049 [Oxalis oulophora]